MLSRENDVIISNKTTITKKLKLKIGPTLLLEKQSFHNTFQIYECHPSIVKIKNIVLMENSLFSFTPITSDALQEA